jgi:hypothetical protein
LGLLGLFVGIVNVKDFYTHEKEVGVARIDYKTRHLPQRSLQSMAQIDDGANAPLDEVGTRKRRAAERDGDGADVPRKSGFVDLCDRLACADQCSETQASKSDRITNSPRVARNRGSIVRPSKSSYASSTTNAASMRRASRSSTSGSKRLPVGLLGDAKIPSAGLSKSIVCPMLVSSS